MPEPFLSSKAVAVRLGVAQSTVRSISAAELPYSAIGRKGVRRYRRIDVEGYASERHAHDDASAARLRVERGPYRKR